MDEKTKKTLKATLFSAITIVVALSFSLVALTYSWYTSNEQVTANFVGITAASPEGGDTLGITSPDSQIVQNKVTLTIDRLLIAAPGVVQIDESYNPHRHYFNGKWYLRTSVGLQEYEFETSPDEPFSPSDSSSSSSSSLTQASESTSAETSSSSSSQTSSSAGAIIKHDVTSILTCAYFDLHLYIDDENQVQSNIFCTSSITAIEGATLDQTAKNNALASSLRYAVELVNIYKTDPNMNLATPWLLFNNAFGQYNGDGTFSSELYPEHTQNIVVPPKSQVRILLWIDANSPNCELAYDGTTKLTLSFDFIGNSN